MCQVARDDGITHIVATPHANAEYRYDRAAYSDRLDELRARVPDMSFSLGCEFHLSYENVRAAVQHPERYVIEGTSYLLVELSEYSAFNLAPTFFELQAAGLRLILAHLERNPVVLAKPDLVDRYLDAGALMQLTANSLTGSWGKRIQKMGESMLRKHQVHFLATDAHSHTHRPPKLNAGYQAAERILGAEAAQKLVQQHPLAVVDNCPRYDIA